jgi:hypothetical protein
VIDIRVSGYTATKARPIRPKPAAVILAMRVSPFIDPPDVDFTGSPKARPVQGQG